MAPKKSKEVTSPDSSDNEEPHYRPEQRADDHERYDMSVLTQKFKEKGVAYLIYELGLRMLYHPGVSAYYRSYTKGNRYLNYDSSAPLQIIELLGINYHSINRVYDWISFVRSHHRSDKRMQRDPDMKLNPQKPESHQINFKFPFGHQVKEKLTMGNLKKDSFYPDSRDQEVYYSSAKDYQSYANINRDIKKFDQANPGIMTRLKENFKRILHGLEPQGNKIEIQFTYELFYQLFAVEVDRDPGAFITIPMALEVWQRLPKQLLVGEGGLIPICFFMGMRVNGYMKNHGTSVKYNYDYKTVQDNRGYAPFLQKEQFLFEKWLELNDVKSVRGEGNPSEVSALLDELYCLCARWYGFTPIIKGYNYVGSSHSPLAPTLSLEEFTQVVQSLQLGHGDGSEEESENPAPKNFIDVNPNGNCFYYSIRKQLKKHGIEKSSKEIKVEAIKYILGHPEYYAYFLIGLNEVPQAQLLAMQGHFQEALHAYINHHLPDSTYADNLMIHATANSQGFVIETQMFNNVNDEHPYTVFPISPNTTPVGTLVVGNIANNHFVSHQPEAPAADDTEHHEQDSRQEEIPTAQPVDDEQQVTDLADRMSRASIAGDQQDGSNSTLPVSDEEHLIELMAKHYHYHDDSYSR